MVFQGSRHQFGHRTNGTGVGVEHPVKNITPVRRKGGEKMVEKKRNKQKRVWILRQGGPRTDMDTILI